ncbi:MAG: TerB family tellurite resistance protein [Bacteroidales bacterium]
MTKFSNHAKFISGATFSFMGLLLGIALSYKFRDTLGIMIMLYLLGILVGPNIIYEFAKPWLKIYLVSGPIGISFIKLSVLIFTADKKLSASEVKKIKAYMSNEFSPEIGIASEKFAKQVSTDKNKIRQICISLKDLTYAERIGFVTQLFSMAASDGKFCDAEEEVIKKIAAILHIGKKRYLIIKANVLNSNPEYQAKEKDKYKNFQFLDQFFIPAYNPFIILGLSNDASIEEIKKTYRELVKTFHPDVTLDKSEGYRKKASEKFIEINDAYEKIKKIRGIK